MNGSMLWMFALCAGAWLATLGWGEVRPGGVVKLPRPAFDGTVSVQRAIKERRTAREFRPTPLDMAQLSQLLWAAQGITDEATGYRAAPSGGALYPLDVYVVVGEKGVETLASGAYWYHPSGHTIELVRDGDRRQDLSSAALGQMWMTHAPVCFVVTAEYRRITGKYGERGIRYAHFEAGHVAENIVLQAGGLGLGAGIVGAFSDASVAKAVKTAQGHEPLLIIPVGYKK